MIKVFNVQHWGRIFVEFLPKFIYPILQLSIEFRCLAFLPLAFLPQFSHCCTFLFPETFRSCLCIRNCVIHYLLALCFRTSPQLGKPLLVLPGHLRHSLVGTLFCFQGYVVGCIFQPSDLVFASLSSLRRLRTSCSATVRESMKLDNSAASRSWRWLASARCCSSSLLHVCCI